MRRKMRLYEGLIESLLLVIENVIGKNDVDSKVLRLNQILLLQITHSVKHKIGSTY